MRQIGHRIGKFLYGFLCISSVLSLLYCGGGTPTLNKFLNHRNHTAILFTELRFCILFCCLVVTLSYSAVPRMSCTKLRQGILIFTQVIACTDGWTVSQIITRNSSRLVIFIIYTYSTIHISIWIGFRCYKQP